MAQARPLMQFRPVSIPSTKAVTRTLRIDGDIEAGIIELADRERVSFNLLANRSLRKFVEWEALAEKFRFVHVPVSAMEKVFGLLSEDEARELGTEAGKNMMPEMVLFWFKKFDLDSSLKMLEMTSRYAKLFTFEHNTDGHTDTVVLKHDRGPNVSAYYAELLKCLFQSLHSLVETQETDGQVVATITKPKGVIGQATEISELTGRRWNGRGSRSLESPIPVSPR